MLSLGGCTSERPLESASESQQVVSRRFACGATTCDATTEYCNHGYICFAEPYLDGGSNEAFDCEPIPSTCSGAEPACDCVVHDLRGGEPSYSPLGASVDPDGATGGCTVLLSCA